ncbi:MAG: flagellar basal body P-ring protein FlgI [Candidatus Hydrogenedentes bacterium]|nr:flagellar basal body P-ring protein FlgI [Candidatus Hydrogenedentota bacterium]
MSNNNLRCWLVALLLWIASAAGAERIGDICEVQGARDNMLKGIGIVVGLAGTGDNTAESIAAQRNVLERLGITVESLGGLSSDNAAMVLVTATIPAFAKEGTRLDVKVDSIFDAESLEGGQLMETHLRGPGLGDTVYAVAQGPVSVGGFNADAGGGTKARKNHVTAGLVPGGGIVEEEVPSRVTDGSRITLLLKHPGFEAAAAIQKAINEKAGEGAAFAMGGGAVQVAIPEGERTDLVAFVNQVKAVEVSTPIPARVVLNERTGTIVVGGDVMIKPCQVAHGTLTIKISSTPQVTPALPFTDAEPVVTETQTVEVEEPEAYLMPVEGTSAGSVAQALNALRVTPRDMISIFQAIDKAGALTAELVIM